MYLRPGIINNPIHMGHIECINKSKQLGDILVVIVNNDYQRELKGSKEFMKQDERKLIVENLKSVDRAVIAIDSDSTVKETIRMLHKEYTEQAKLVYGEKLEKTLNGLYFSQDLEHVITKKVINMQPHFIFAKGGDRKVGEIAEQAICDELGIKVVDGLGEKIQSSSWLLNKT